jgi:hypothetical protein
MSTRRAYDRRNLYDLLLRLYRLIWLDSCGCYTQLLCLRNKLRRNCWNRRDPILVWLQGWRLISISSCLTLQNIRLKWWLLLLLRWLRILVWRLIALLALSLLSQVVAVHVWDDDKDEGATRYIAEVMAGQRHKTLSRCSSLCLRDTTPSKRLGSSLGNWPREQVYTFYKVYMYSGQNSTQLISSHSRDSKLSSECIVKR